MPYYKCTSCHHEFEHIPRDNNLYVLCDWCNAPCSILELETPLEKLARKVEEHGGWDKYAKNVLGVSYGETKRFSNR